MIIWRALRSLMIAALIILIRGYQLIVAPLFIGGCRHLPTCSAYAVEAIERHGPWQGTRLAAARLWRCRPGGTFGHDPVP